MVFFEYHKLDSCGAVTILLQVFDNETTGYPVRGLSGNERYITCRPVGNFYAYYGNTAVDLDPLPVSRARLTMVDLALFE